MRIAVITVAGISSRFNEGIDEDMKVLKCLYSEGGKADTLLYHLVKKCDYADRIVIVGGYKFNDLKAFCDEKLSSEFPNISLVENTHFSDYGSGYSLYLGIVEAMKYAPDEVLFVEGDLDIDNDSFRKVVDSEHSVLTYTSETIYANKAVVLYMNNEQRYKYAFNSSHGLLKIDEPFSCILNSGQTWKFKNTEALAKANEAFFKEDVEGTNLSIIQRYIDSLSEEDIEIIHLLRWTNCNTRNDYRNIMNYWRGEA